jgi:hypothetical protein
VVLCGNPFLFTTRHVHTNALFVGTANLCRIHRPSQLLDDISLYDHQNTIHEFCIVMFVHYDRIIKKNKMCVKNNRWRGTHFAQQMHSFVQQKMAA